VAGEHPGGHRDISLSYDDAGQVTVLTDSLGRQTTYHFNASGQIVREVDPLGNATTSRWDDQDRLLARTDPLGRTTSYRYDAAGNLTVVTRPDGRQATATYNRLGLPVTVVDPDGSVYRQEFDERGNLLSIADPLGATTRYEYDQRGGLTAITDALGNTRRFTADAAGLPISSAGPFGATIRFARNPGGRISAIVGPLGEVTRFGWTPGGQLAWRQLPGDGVERWSYDAEDNLVEHVDPAGRTTRLECAHFDLPVARTDPDGSRTEFGYDTEGQLTSVTNPRGEVWRFEYDPAGRLVRETDLNGRELTYAYDAAGQVAELTNGLGQHTRYVRDPLGNVVEQHASDQVSIFEYDPVGYLTRAVGPDAELVLERDPLGRVLAETCDGRTITSRYDLLGRRVYRRTPSGAETWWEYGADELPAAMHTGGQTLRFGYDAARREVARRIGADLLLTRTWDTTGRQRSQTLTAGGLAAAGAGPRPLQHTAYSYRPDGEVTAIDSGATARHYDLDAAGRVTAVRASGWTERYAYDALGALTGAAWPGGPDRGAPATPMPGDGPGSNGASRWEYAGSRLRHAGTVRFEYDTQGRVTLRQQRTLSSGPRTWHFSWDAADRLTGVVTPDGARWRYRYDPIGRRIGKLRIVAGAVAEQVDFTWDGQVLAEQAQPGAGRATVWTWEPDGFRPLTQIERVPAREAPQGWADAQFYAIVTDLVGTPTDLVTPAGEVAWHGPTTLWGLPSGATDGVEMPLRFPGQYHDPETGLHYNYHRYYDPATARYQSPDPLGLDGGADPHAYVSNPCGWTDPLGLVSYKELRQMMKSQKFADDLLNKGVHFNVGRLEIKAVPTHLGGVTFKAVMKGQLRTMPKEFAAAFKKSEEALTHPEFVQWLRKHAVAGYQYAQPRGHAKALEFKLLIRALDKL
jgi:RHS repeat-associated protein